MCVCVCVCVCSDFVVIIGLTLTIRSLLLLYWQITYQYAFLKENKQNENMHDCATEKLSHYIWLESFQLYMPLKIFHTWFAFIPVLFIQFYSW